MPPRSGTGLSSTAQPGPARCRSRPSTPAGSPTSAALLPCGSGPSTAWTHSRSGSASTAPRSASLRSCWAALSSATTRPDAPDAVRLTGYLEDRPVGTALMFAAHDVAGIYVVTTAEAHRRRGVGSALTSAALHAGRERGLRTGTLQASSLGAGVYRRMGFHVIDEYELFRFP
ncbi:GNAT family N-acetyltransferase [Streptomyces sp. NPDC048192]|uniref:GNAT family N-acetyltransferase n=1 Tax=Streptomyces sp. NPDC048192 TaxID=3365510 RepID=UPI003710F2F5